MKNTKLMLACIATFLVTYLTIGLFIYLLSDTVSYKEILTKNYMVFIMLILGWIPSVTVGIDLEERLEK